MVYEARKQSMAWMETDYSKDMYFRCKVKWRLEHLGTLGTMGEAFPFRRGYTGQPFVQLVSQRLKAHCAMGPAATRKNCKRGEDNKHPNRAKHCETKLHEGGVGEVTLRRR